jgi:hypothetical protein
MPRSGQIARLCLAFGLVTFSSAAFAGAWTLEEGSGQVIVTATPSSSTQIFDGSRGLEPFPRYDKFEFQGLLEYGLTDRFTGIFETGLQHIDIAAPFDAQRTGLGYTEFGGRYKLMENESWVFSGQATVRIPGTFDNNNPAAIGYNDVEADVRALIGHSFSISGMSAFVDAQFAQRFRSNGLPDELHFDATFGIRPAPRWLILLQNFSVISEGPAPSLFPSYDYHKLQLSAVYALTSAWSVQLGGFTTYAGRNALQENGLLTGVWYKF